MINQYLTIAKVAHELKINCIDSHLIDCISFRKNEFLFQFSNGRQLSVFLYPAKPFIFVSPADKIPGANLFHFFKPIYGKKLLSVKLHISDRVLNLNFENDFSVFIQLFSATSGMTLIGNAIEESYKNKSIQADLSNFKDINSILSDTSIIESNLRFFPDWILNELKNKSSLESIKQNLHSYNTYWIYKAKNKSIISPFEIIGLEAEHVYSNGSSQIKFTVIHQAQTESFEKEKSALLKTIQRRISQLQSTIQQLKQYIDNEMNLTEFEHQANLLYSQPDLTMRGVDKISVADIINNPEVNVTIKLSPNLTILENANLLFQRIKKFREIKNEKRFLLQAKITELQKIEETRSLLESVSEAFQLRDFKKRNRNFLREHSTQDKAISEPFHRIRSEHGYEILIGKHAKGNDFLLSNICKKNDVWFHCKGDSGSHVILSNHTKEMPNKKQLDEAAGYAAYFSGQKNSEWVPVTYTFCKYVRKVKGGAPGAVILEREDVIFVKPVKPGKVVSS